MERHYPTRNGIAISPYELDLPKAYKLETNNHHGEFEARHFGNNIILTTLRNLAVEQWELPIDQHSWIHMFYIEPIIPDLSQAMYKIEEQLDCGGLLKIKHKGKGYVERLLTDNDFKQCKDFHDSLKR